MLQNPYMYYSEDCTRRNESKQKRNRKVYNETGTISRRLGSGRPSKITEEVKMIVEQQR